MIETWLVIIGGLSVGMVVTGCVFAAWIWKKHLKETKGLEDKYRYTGKGGV